MRLRKPSNAVAVLFGACVLLIVVTALISGEPSNRITFEAVHPITHKPLERAERLGSATLAINNIRYDPFTIEGDFTFQSLERALEETIGPPPDVMSPTLPMSAPVQVERDFLLTMPSRIEVNGVTVVPRFEQPGTYQVAHISANGFGNMYFFPFESHSVLLGINGDRRDYLPIDLTVETRGIPFDVTRVEPTFFLGTWFIELHPATFYRVLVVMVIISLLVLLALMWRVPDRTDLLTLGIGVFAALFALRGFLIPIQISTPLLLDQIILGYFVLIVFSMVFRFMRMIEQGH